MDARETLHRMARTGFVARSPLTREALAFAHARHAGQTRDLDGLPFVTHPVEVARLLHEAGYADEVVAAGVLHDVLEDTDADHGELEHRFGRRVAAIFAADKVSKARELRLRRSRGRPAREDGDRIVHYEASLEMLAGLIPGHDLVD